MKQFDVIVNPKSVVIQAKGANLTTYDVRANVDGEKYLYRIVKQVFMDLRTGWRERGYVQAFYHAKNAGNNVQFLRVDAPGARRKVERSPHQLRLFD